jgi:hypothetical protein
MATELMKDWIVELHNPERKQTQGYLGVLDLGTGVVSNCCLGVLCEVNGLEPTTRDDDVSSAPGVTLYYDGMSGLAPYWVISNLLEDDGSRSGAVGSTIDLFEDEGVDYEGCAYTRTVTADEANDEFHLTFKEIAEKLSERYLTTEEQFEVRKRVEDLGWA